MTHISIPASFSLINCIREYAEPVPTSESLVPEQNVVNATLLKIFSGIQWERQKAIKRTNSKSCDKIWIQRDLKLFVKLDSKMWRSEKNKPVVPYAEECASRIAQLLKWPEVPHTVVIHESQVDDVHCAYFKPLMHCFMNNGEMRGCPVTFTFQTLVEGTALPCEYDEWLVWKNRRPAISYASYQRAYLFAWLVGKGDGFFCNTLHNSKNGTFYEVDNEVIGESFYSGVLHRFASVKLDPIEKCIYQSILDLDPEKLSELFKSYDKKNEQIIKLWKQENLNKPKCRYTLNLPIQCKRIHESIRKRMEQIQEVMRSAILEKEEITLIKVESALENRLRKNPLYSDYIYEKQENEIYDS